MKLKNLKPNECVKVNNIKHAEYLSKQFEWRPDAKELVGKYIAKNEIGLFYSEHVSAFSEITLPSKNFMPKKSKTKIIDEVIKDYDNRLSKIEGKLFGKNEPIGNSEQLELEVGKWYKHKGSKFLFCINYLTGIDIRAYGFDSERKFKDIMVVGTTENIEPATKEEVQEALINEAKRRGFVKGIKFKNALNNLGIENANKGILSLEEDFEFDQSIYLDGNTIFYEGKWAEIVKKPKYEIDFSVPGQLVQSVHEYSKDLIIQTTGLQKEYDTFCGFVTKENKSYRKGDVSDDWACKEFKLYEPI